MSFSNFRARKSVGVVRTADDDDSQANQDSMAGEEVSVKTSAATGKRPKKEGKAKKVALSFGVDENQDESEFKIKKSTASRKLNRGAEYISSVAATDAGTESRTYDVESLRQLKESSSRPNQSAVSSTNTVSPFSSQLTAGEAIDVDSIPDAGQIFAARKLREQRRAQQQVEWGPDQTSGGTSDDFVSLTSRSGAVSTSRTARESRLMTEDQEYEGEEAFEDHEGDHIAFGAKDNAKAKMERRAGIASHLADAQGDDDDRDEDMEEWEKEHIRIGGARATLEAQERFDDENRGRKSTARAFAVPEPTAIPTLSDLNSQITTVLSSLRSSMSSNDTLVDHLSNQIAESTKSSASLKHDVEVLGDRYALTQETREFISDLAEFLDEKVAELEIMEEELASIERQRLEEREAMWREVTDGAFGAMTTAGTVRPVSLSAPLENLFVQLDHPLTTSEQSVAITRRLESLRNRHRHLFGDSLPTFSDLDQVLPRIADWSQKYPEDFVRGYGGDSIHGIVDLWARWEILGSELDASPPDLESTTWHGLLTSLVLPSSSSDTTLPDATATPDPDASLETLVKVVEKSVIPQLKLRVDSWVVWDKKETGRLVGWIEAVRGYVGGTSEAYKSLQASLLDRVSLVAQEVADRCDFSRFPPKVDSAAGVVVARGVWWEAMQKLLTSTLHVRKFLPHHGARGLVVDSIVEKCMMPALSRSSTFSDELGRVSKLVSALPVDWTRGMITSAPRFAAVMQHLGEANRGNFSEAESKTFESIMRVVEN
ncbi:hypothetical protein M427DRAFT_156693 [Gonapodya prolifera JEL478]|uniref:GCFC-domain-containing protein n=1 Tax=Gonapodya prolifera (strain JEL478) TaxID=1344416 RepID=A0A139A9R1_GONPJ|nr:hypothetical protein M427DRAFT_156693 [Gonapodya prolifera JEL478]|eukprot:KXS13409.1 hypothetical protein M427DRAFT_156693 [Gonapodya prolifera JEL478]